MWFHASETTTSKQGRIDVVEFFVAENIIYSNNLSDSLIIMFDDVSYDEGHKYFKYVNLYYYEVITGDYLTFDDGM